MTTNHTERTLMTVEECDAQILSAQYVLDNPDEFDIEVRVQADKDKRRYGYFRDYAAALQAERRRADAAEQQLQDGARAVIERAERAERRADNLANTLRHYAVLDPDEVPYRWTINDDPDIGYVARAELAAYDAATGSDPVPATVGPSSRVGAGRDERTLHPAGSDTLATTQTKDGHA